MLAGRGQEFRELVRAEEIDGRHLLVIGDQQIEAGPRVAMDRVLEAGPPAEQAYEPRLRLHAEILAQDP